MNHKPDGSAVEGSHKTIAVAEAPRMWSTSASAPPTLIGDQLPMIDIKTGPEGPIVIEINDNPNLEHGVEDEADNAVWHRLTEWFVKRLNA